jgi:signal transduction histidine kinase
MECLINRRISEPSLYSCDSIVTEVNNEFIDFTGFTMDELVGKSIIEIGDMLKINSQIFIDNIDSYCSGYIFTRLLETREVNISCIHSKETNEKIYTFSEKENSRLEDKLLFVEQTFIENLRGAAIYSVSDSIVLKVNQRYLDFMEPPFNKEENCIGKSIKECVTRVVGSQFQTMWDSVIETQKSKYIKEFRFDDFVKGISYWDTILTPIFENGEMKYIFVTATEVTKMVIKNQGIKRKNKMIEQQKEELEEQKKELEAIIENISEGIAIVNKKGQYTLLNKAAREGMFPYYEYMDKAYDGYKQCEIYDSNGEKINLEDIPACRVARGEKFNNMRMTLKIPNKILQLDVSGTPIYDNEGEFSLGVICSRDMTNYINHEETIRSRYELLDKIIDTFDLPVIRLSCPDLKVVDINKKAFKIIELLRPGVKSINQIKGGNIEELLNVAKIDEYYKCIIEVLEEKKTKYLNKRKHFINGNEEYWNLIFEPLLGANGEIEEILMLTIDVTSEIKANIIMENALKLQEEIFANISHELKTPLNIIFSTAQLLNLYCESGSLDQRKNSIIKYIDSIKQNSHRLSKLINNIVDLSKIQAGFFELNFSNNNIVEVVEEIVTSVTNFTEVKGINIIFDTDVEEKIIACDPEKIARIVLNLISNAIKFSEVGDEILVDVKDNDEFVEISVKDNGIGIEEQDIDMIFDRFKQVDKSLSRNAEGTGIGLSLVKSIVELHGGHIYVESKFGEGSKFIVVLPSRELMQGNMLFSNKIKTKIESVQVELSDIIL